MTHRHPLLRVAVCLVALVLPAGLAAAQQQQPQQQVIPRIATVNPAKVFNEMQETKDLKQKMEADRKSITDEGQRRSAEVEDAKKRRTLFTEGSEDATKANKDYMEKVMSAQVWQEMIKVDLQRQQKNQMKALFEKIELATREVAEGAKIDLVIVEQRVDLPADLDQINVDQLRGLINQRTVLYNNGRLDITNEVLARVDAKYKTKK